MTKLAAVLVPVLLAAGVAGALLLPEPLANGTEPRLGEPSNEKTAEQPRSENAAPRAVVRLSAEQQLVLGLRTERVKRTSIQRQIKGYGRVLSPLTLADQVAALRSAEAAARASTSEYKRAKMLNERDQNVSTAVLEGSRAAAIHDQVQLQRARNRLIAVWGPKVAEREDLDRFAELLIARRLTLVRVDLPLGTVLSSPPAKAFILIPGAPSEPVVAESLGPAPDVNPSLQGPGYFFTSEFASDNLAPGAFVLARLAFEEPPTEGVLLPRSAILHALGVTSVYVQEDSETFVRKGVDLVYASKADTVAARGLTPGARIVVSGVQELWLQERGDTVGRLEDDE